MRYFSIKRDRRKLDLEAFDKALENPSLSYDRLRHDNLLNEIGTDKAITDRRWRRRIELLVEAAHYGTAYCADRGTIETGLEMNGRTLSIFTQGPSGGGKTVTQVQTKEDQQVVLHAEYTARQGKTWLPTYKIEGMYVQKYIPGDWERRLLSVKEDALWMREKSMRRAYRAHYIL